MKEEKKMFEAIEMHLERMLATRSANEKKQNTSLAKHERRMKEILKQLREDVTSEQRPVEESEASNASVK